MRTDAGKQVGGGVLFLRGPQVDGIEVRARPADGRRWRASPRSGGEAAKFGERYEGRWTTRQLLHVLGGRVDSVTVEDVGELSLGAEFTLRCGDEVEVHQVKRQHGSANEWKLSDLNGNGVLAAASHHASEGRRYWFVSTIPCQVLSRLADAARRSPDVWSFVEHMLGSEPLRAGWDYLTGSAYGSPEVTLRTLQ